MKICRIATVPFFLQNHLKAQIISALNAGHDVTLVCGDGPEIPELYKLPGVRLEVIDIPRQISLLRDVRALWVLFLFFRKQRFDITHSTTPKAGMLSALASFFARVPIRLHTFTGQPWMELHGLLRFVAKAGDWVTAHLATMNYADSFTQRDFLIEQGVAAENKITVLGKGSLAGVDVSRFDQTRWLGQVNAMRGQLGISDHAVVVTFIGRLTRDKGVSELVDAFAKLPVRQHPCVLLLVGPQEPDRDPLPVNTLEKIRADHRIIEVGYSPEPEKYLALTDIFCLPSYREGFGNVVVEAAAMGIPTVGTDIVGLRDAVVNNVTGLLVPPKNVDGLAAGLEKLLLDAQLRHEMGEQAKLRARREFDSSIVNAAVLNEYDRLALQFLGQRSV